MLPTLVLSALLSTALPASDPAPLQDLQPRLEQSVDAPAPGADEDGFDSDVNGFPERRAAAANLADVRGWESPLHVARTFLGVWVAASALFGLVWGLLGWATRSRLSLRA